MSQDLMNYEHMTQLALRGVVRDAIRRVIREDGLPGAHHFYITFLTRFPDIEIDESLAKKYPEEITIVLEHQFWDLSANAEDFEVTLKFGGIPKYLKVPYNAVTRFHDPSVGFALQFEPPKAMEAETATLTQLVPEAKPSGSKSPLSKPNDAKKGAGAKPSKKATAKSADENLDSKPTPDDDPSTQQDTEKVVSLDSFRKK